MLDPSRIVSDSLRDAFSGDAGPARNASPTAGSKLTRRERAVVLAFAEATVPGGGSVERADERTLAALEELLEHVQPGLTRLLAKAAQTLDQAARLRTGRPFRKLDVAAQEKLMIAWEASPVLRTALQAIQFAIKFAHFDRKEVYGGLGGKLNVVKGLESERWHEQVVRAETWGDDDIECEVVVIGTGAGGAVVGRELAERGYAVCFVEEGQFHRRDAFTGSSIQAHRDFYRGGMAVGNNLFPVFMGRMVGGSTAINTGTCFRTPSAVLDRWCEEMRTDDFSRTSMTPYFERVESILEVGPAPRRFVGPISDVFERGCDALGWSHFPIRRNAPGCEGEGFCDFGCRTDARRSTNISYVPPALSRGSMLFTGLRAERVIIENGRAAGVECTAIKNGKRIKVRGRAVVLACGAVPTPLFLLRQGICNSSGQVGHNLTLHPSGAMNALFDDDIDPWKHVPQGWGCDEFLGDGMLFTAAQPDFNLAPLMYAFGGQRLMQIMNDLGHIASFGLLIADDARGRVALEAAGSAIVRYDLTAKDAHRLHQSVVRMSEICWAAGAKKIWPAVLGWNELATRRDFERFKKADVGPSNFLLTSYHPLGTCKMGKDPATSVVDLDHQTHDLPSLYVVDGSTVPGPLGVNPQVTIMAMATRAAERIADHLG